MKRGEKGLSGQLDESDTKHAPRKFWFCRREQVEKGSRRLSNRGSVLSRGQRALIAGLVCMDMMMVDVTRVVGISVGHEAIIISPQGDDQITADDIAKWTGTIAYEVLCTIGPHVPRLYHEG
ncbi:MAG: hypothetical protein HP490_11035 [Nitrospira sp.]|nr:hypothetical protein [Nitrospira sp.]